MLELRAEEPRRALISLEMIIRNNYAYTTTYGVPYYNKPPLFNWVLAFFYNIFNSSNEFTTRLPGILSCLTIAILLGMWVKHEKGRFAGISAALFWFFCADIFSMQRLMPAKLIYFLHYFVC